MYSDWSVVAPACVAESLVAAVALLEVALKRPVAVRCGGGKIVAVALPHMWEVEDDTIVHSYGPHRFGVRLPVKKLKYDRELCYHMAGHRAPKRVKLEDDAPAFVSGDDSSDDEEVYIEQGDTLFWVGDDRYDANGMRVYK